MKASQFIQTALIDQMQIIADAGLWLHLSKLIPSGVEVLARTYGAAKENHLNVEGSILLPDTTVAVVKRFMQDFAPEYGALLPNKDFYSSSPTVLLTSKLKDAALHLTRNTDGLVYIHVPLLFEDFKAWCGAVISMVNAGECIDIEVFKTGDQ